jgi:hypothetical protein
MDKMSARTGQREEGTPLTYRAVSRLGLIPVMGCEMVESVQDVLVGDACEAGRRVGPRDERGSRRGHGYLVVVVSGDEERSRGGRGP